ncbi:hypothetical protein UlMin_017550 [Ulmus minor]
MELQGMQLLLIIFLTFFSFLWLVKQSKKFAKNIVDQKPPPGPWKLPVIGNLHNLAGSLPHHALLKLAQKYGPLMHLQLGKVSAVVVSSPKMAREVMKTHDLSFAQRPVLLSPKIVSYNCTDLAFAPYGDYWRQMRKICILELLSSKRVLSFALIRANEVQNLVQSIRSSAGLPFDLTKKLFLLSSSITSRAAFGNQCKEHDEFLSMAKKVIQLGGGFDLADLFPSNKFLQLISRTRVELERIHLEADKILESIIQQHKHRQIQINEPTEKDLVDVLLEVQQSGSLEFPITTDNIKAVVWDIFAAGTDTSSTTVDWAMAEMMKNPRVMEKAQAEIRQVFRGKQTIDETEVHNLSYLKLVIKETLRLHPPLPLLLPRECRESCELEGYKIPIKTKVIVNAWAIGRDPEHWHEAESFIPERFDNSSIDYKGTNFEFIPFGAGRRICPGISFGLVNVEFPLAQLLFHFNWELPSGMKPEELDMTETFGATVGRKNHLYLIATPFNSFM